MTQEWHFAGDSQTFTEGEPVGRNLGGKALVFVRSGGRLRCFADRCPHRGFPLSHAKAATGEAGVAIRCAYHGWAYNAEGELTERPGIVEAKPPAFCLPSFRMHEAGAYAFVCFASPTVEAAIPSWLHDLGDERMHDFAVVSAVRAAPADVLENLLDPFHTHYVHGTLLRRGARRNVIDVLARYSAPEQTLTMEYLNEPQPEGWVSKLFERGRVKGIGRYHHPNSAVLEYWTTRGLDLRVTLPISVSADGLAFGSIIFQVAPGGLPFFLKRPILKAFARSLVRQDQVALELLQANKQRFPGSAPWLGPEDVVLDTMRTLAAGRELPSFERRYQIQI